VQSAELTLANLLSTISREQYSYVGIVATMYATRRFSLVKFENTACHVLFTSIPIFFMPTPT